MPCTQWRACARTHTRHLELKKRADNLRKLGLSQDLKEHAILSLNHRGILKQPIFAKKNPIRIGRSELTGLKSIRSNGLLISVSH
jgi:hypothetical protein